MLYFKSQQNLFKANYTKAIEYLEKVEFYLYCNCANSLPEKDRITLKQCIHHLRLIANEIHNNGIINAKCKR